MLIVPKVIRTSEWVLHSHQHTSSNSLFLFRIFYVLWHCPGSNSSQQEKSELHSTRNFSERPCNLYLSLAGLDYITKPDENGRVLVSLKAYGCFFIKVGPEINVEREMSINVVGLQTQKQFKTSMSLPKLSFFIDSGV